jgi:enoyl-CoA hydratase/carnithine racemase
VRQVRAAGRYRDPMVRRKLAAAHDIADNVAPVSAAITKLAARRFLQETDQQAALDLERRLFRWAGQHADAQEGVAAFKEKRPPHWTLSKSTDFPTDLLGT